MPRIVNYSDRADAVGEKLVALAVDHGHEAMTRERVAAALGWSLSTLRRLVTSEDLLPGTGVRWIEQVRRYRYFRTMRTLGRNRDPWRHWTALIDARSIAQTRTYSQPAPTSSPPASRRVPRRDG